MLKVFLGFVVSVVGLLSSAYVSGIAPRAYATSANVLITQIQAGGVGAATQEFIVIYNNSPDEVDITNWCLTNKSGATITCFNTPVVGQAMYLPAYKHAVAVSTSFPSVTATMFYAPISQSSGSVTGGSDTISLVDHIGTVIDRQAWTTSLAAGMQFDRHGAGTPMIYVDTDLPADWSVTQPGPLPVNEAEIDTTVVDVCLNIDGIQTVVPAGKELSLEGECVPRPITKLDLTEVLPNANGSDEGQEFIELYNPNDKAADLANYVLYVGLNDENVYAFPAGSIIQPRHYLSFSNADIPFTLLNSSSRVRVVMKDDGTVVSEVSVYTNPPDGESWALIDDQWQYTNQPTPGLANIAMDDALVISASVSTLQPCALNQYRSPETNHCRLLSTLGTTVTPCKDGQYRSEETNRCRNIASDAKTVTPCGADEERNADTNRCRKVAAASQPAPCKEGQERSPDTNRCRTITKMPSAGYGVANTQTKSGGNWYVWAAIGGVLLLALSYAIWEWHDEIGRFFRKHYFRITGFARIHK